MNNHHSNLPLTKTVTKFSQYSFQHWDVFKHIGELFILVPSLLGLKGNLDMCLASRLSTQANLGNMTSKSVILKMIIGNIALVQVQATVAAFTVSLFAIGVGQGMEQQFNFNNAMVVVASAMFTATSSCFVLGKTFAKMNWAGLRKLLMIIIFWL